MSNTAVSNKTISDTDADWVYGAEAIGRLIGRSAESDLLHARRRPVARRDV